MHNLKKDIGLRVRELRKKIFPSAEAAAAAGVATWPHNVMRHSFASYHLALHRDAPLTAHELGHSSPCQENVNMRAGRAAAMRCGPVRW